MRRDLWEVCLDIYRQLFREAEPSADFDQLVASDRAYRPGFFMDYYLDQSRQDAIVVAHCRKHHLNRIQTNAVMSEVCLGCSPRGCVRTPTIKSNSGNTDEVTR